MAHLFSGFIDRIVEHPGRVRLTNLSQGTAAEYDMERAEGTVSIDGTPFSAEKFNRIADDIMDIGQENADLIAQDLANSLTLDWGSGTVKYDKIGSLVIVYVSVQFSFDVEAGGTLDFAGTIASADRPSVDQYGLIRGLESPYLVARSNGKLRIESRSETIASGTAIKGEVAYYV